MTGEPQATIERWAQRLSDRQPPDELTAFVSREVPGAVRSAAERGLPLVVYRLTPWVAATVLLRRSAVFTLDLGWSRGREYAAWVCVAALGPGGLVRVSGRPAALGEVLGLDAPVLRPADAGALSDLLAAAVLPESGPTRSAMTRTQWEARKQSTVLTAHRLAQLDRGEFDWLTPLDPAAWRQARAAIAPPTLEPAAGDVVVTFWYLDATGGPDTGDLSSSFRLLRLRCALRDAGPGSRGQDDAGRRAIETRCDDAGEFSFAMPSGFSLGRPLVVGGARRQAALVRRGG